MLEQVTITRWNADQAQWPELLQLVALLNQAEWLRMDVAWHISSIVLVAAMADQPRGFLRFVVQEIGADMDRPIVTFSGEPLTEAKVLAFGVDPRFRQQGLGRALQLQALHLARQLGCYQMRSHSSGDHVANHHLKLSMGFAVDPIVRGDDRRGVYFNMPLKTTK